MRDQSTGLPLGNWRYDQIPCGAGGFCTGIDIHASGRAITRVDVFNSYIKNTGDEVWNELLTSVNAPYPQSLGDGSYGGFETVFAPSDVNRIYHVCQGSMYRSDDSGATFSIKTSFGPFEGNSNDIRQQDSDGSPRLAGKKIAVDPVNKDVAYVGTQVDGVRFTSDGFATCSAVSGIPAVVENGNTPHCTIIAFNPASAVVGSGAAARTQEILIAIDATGVYRTTNGGASFAAMSGAPTKAQHLVCSSDGTFYLADRSNVLKKCVNGSWSTINVPLTVHAIAVYPGNSQRIVVISAYAELAQTLDGGATWTTFGTTVKAKRIGWQGLPLGIAVGDIQFNPVDGKLWLSDGLGTRTAVVPNNTSGGTVVFVDDSVGIENLASNQIWALPNGRIHAVSWDRPVFTFTKPFTYQNTYGPVIPINAGWDLDYKCDDPNFLAVLVSQMGERSSTSSDGGKTWNLLAGAPPGVGGDGGKPFGGNIAIGADKGTFFYLCSNDAGMWRTTDWGANWTPIAIANVPTTPAVQYGTLGWHHAYYLNRKTLVADRVTPGTLYMYNSGADGVANTAGVYRSTDSGLNWSKVFAGTLMFGSNFNFKMLTVPGKAGHLFACNGGDGSTTNPLMRSLDGGATWSNANTDVGNPSGFGFGKPLNPDGYPSVFFYGYYKGDLAMWMSWDNCVSFHKMTVGFSPRNTRAVVGWIAGDPLEFGRVYYVLQGGSFGTGTYGTDLLQS